MKTLTNYQSLQVLKWLTQFKLSKPYRKLTRDFSDGVLMAEILKQLHPKLVELHNYPPRSSTTLKFDNWVTLNRKVLKKIKQPQTYETLKAIARGCTGYIDTLLYELMLRTHAAALESAVDENEVIIKVPRDINGEMELVSRKFVSFENYEKVQKQLMNQNSTILLLVQKIEHLEAYVKEKNKCIAQLTRELQIRSGAANFPPDVFATK